MARKQKPPTFNIECLQHGAWLWVILPPFRNKGDAESYAQQMAERAPGSSYRVVEG